MNVQIEKIGNIADECVTIACVAVTPDIEKIRSYALTKGTTLTGHVGERIHPFSLSDVLYFEAVDERVFACTKRQTYELRCRLYEVENEYADRHFIRCSKSFVLNLMQLQSISPALNGRFAAHMRNGETLIITRQYVPALKRAVLGGT